MVCQGCHGPSSGPLCRTCQADFRRPPDKVLGVGVRLITAFEHRGAPARMMHDLKYRGLRLYAAIVAEALVDRVPPVPVVPVPRVWGRLIKYGVDPAREIALELGKRNGAPILDLLVRQVHAPRRAGGDHTIRPVPFRARASGGQVVVVDDVVTTGATLSRAIAAIGPKRVEMAIAANDAMTRSTLAPDEL